MQFGVRTSYDAFILSILVLQTFCSFTYNNMSSLCNESQYFAIRALVGNSPPNRIAAFGNTSVSSVNSWATVVNTTTGSSSCSVSDV